MNIDCLFNIGNYVWKFCLINLLLTISIFSQERISSVAISNKDVIDTINALKTANPEKSVALFKQKIPPPVTDKKFRQSILEGLSKRIFELQIQDQFLTNQISKFIQPILDLYNRTAYQIIIIDFKAPFVMNDSGVVLVLSTGLFLDAESDDEILGYIAHEVGHDYYTNYAIYTKHLYRLVNSSGKEQALLQRFADVLALLELQCDAFSAITLAYLDYDPTAFIDGLERDIKKYKDDPHTFHPPERMRRKVVESVVPLKYLKPEKRRVSSLLTDIKEIVKVKYQLKTQLPIITKTLFLPNQG